MNRRKSLHWASWLVGAAFVLACNTLIAPESTPTSVPSPIVATETAVMPTIVPTDTPAPTQTSQAEILYEEDFSSNPHDWETGSESKEGGMIEKTISDGQYIVNLASVSEYFVSIIEVPDFSGKDFVMSVDVTVLDSTLTDIPGNLRVWFDVRNNAPKYYSFTCSSRECQLIRAMSWNVDEDVILWDWTNAPSLNLDRGVTNTFKFEVNETDFALYINGEKVNSATDDVLNESGGIAFALLLSPANEAVTVAFDNLLIQSPQP